MIVWTVWIHADETTWLEVAWDDDSVDGNRDGYMEAVRKARKIADDNDGEARIIKLDVPFYAIQAAFADPKVEATVVKDEG